MQGYGEISQLVFIELGAVFRFELWFFGRAFAGSAE